MAFTESALIIFLRAPERGKVKTRLAATLGDEAALKIYNELCALTMHLADQTEMPVFIYFEGQYDLLQTNTKFQYRKQSIGDLGDKIFHSVNEILQFNSKAIIIGSDCPELTNKDLIDAISLLDTHDFVFGPAEEGGFYLMGCKNLAPAFFKNISWGTGSVLATALNAVEQLKQSYALLRTLQDIDTAEDWRMYVERRS